MDVINEIELIMSELTTGFSDINMGNYLKCVFILLSILLMVLIVRIIIGNISKG